MGDTIGIGLSKHGMDHWLCSDNVIVADLFNTAGKYLIFDFYPIY